MQIVRRRRTVTTGRSTLERIYAGTVLTAGQADAPGIAQRVHDHWGTENEIHRVRDTTGAEDASRIRARNAPWPMAELRHLAIGALRLASHTNIAACLLCHAQNSNHPLATLGIMCSPDRSPERRRPGVQKALMHSKDDDDDTAAPPGRARHCSEQAARDAAGDCGSVHATHRAVQRLQSRPAPPSRDTLSGRESTSGPLGYGGRRWRTPAWCRPRGSAPLGRPYGSL